MHHAILSYTREFFQCGEGFLVWSITTPPLYPMISQRTKKISLSTCKKNGSHRISMFFKESPLDQHMGSKYYETDIYQPLRDSESTWVVYTLKRNNNSVPQVYYLLIDTIPFELKQNKSSSPSLELVDGLRYLLAWNGR